MIAHGIRVCMWLADEGLQCGANWTRLRHGYTGKWAAMMVQSEFFKVVRHHHVVVGDAHEDIHGFFGPSEVVYKHGWPRLGRPPECFTCVAFHANWAVLQRPFFVEMQGGIAAAIFFFFM